MRRSSAARDVENPTGPGPETTKDCVTDLELVERAQEGDSDAFGILVERHHRAALRAAVAALGAADDADDAVQEAWIAARDRLAGFRGEAAFRTWLLAITWRKALDRRKSVGRWLRLTVSQADHDSAATNWIEHMPADRRSQEEDLAAQQLQQAIRRLIRTLPRNLRDALLLAGSGEYSYSQIGFILGVPVGTVKWRVSEARRVLKEKMAAVGHHYDG